MTDEQLRLMAQVLIGMCAASDWIIPYNSWGANVGQCRYCGTVGRTRHGIDIEYEHKDTCVILLCEQLDQSLAKEQG